MSAGVIGVDFSGASTAGDALWVTEATQTSVGLRIEDCYRATDKWGRDRETAHAGLVDRITDGDISTAGLDFPFSLPQQLLDGQCGGSWRGFLDWVGGDDGPADPKSFTAACRRGMEAATDGAATDRRRETDYQRAGLCPYAEYVQHQTFYGARNVLGPLAADTDTAVAPMQGADAETVVCEVYPAATFGWLGCYREGYKNADGERARRVANVDAIVDCSVALGEHRETYVENHDALDSLAAAFSAARVDAGARPTPVGTAEEGQIYL